VYSVLGAIELNGDQKLTISALFGQRIIGSQVLRPNTGTLRNSEFGDHVIDTQNVLA
jgi:hypothetical protein